MSGEFKVSVEVKPSGMGFLRWEMQQVSPEVLQQAIAIASRDALENHQLRRLQVDIPANDLSAIRALHRAGFRREGRLRSAFEVSPNEYVDVLVYARLAIDPVEGGQGFSSVMDSVLPTKRIIAHVVFTDPQGRVLLTETTYKPDWELPGGVVDPGEPPRLGAQREVLEEIGLAFEFSQPALVDWMPPYLGWSDAVEFIYRGGELPHGLVAALRPSDVEIKALHWVAPEDLDAVVTPLSARRIRLVLEGYDGATEDGEPVTN